MTAISPFNDYAKAGLKTWQTYAGPTKGFDEMVFNIRPIAGGDHKTPPPSSTKPVIRARPLNLIPASCRS